MSLGYLNTPVNESYHIDVTDGHSLYVEECGNPEGIPVVFLHGGPGGAISEKSRRFFNPEKYRIILFDQRGTGRSKPFLSLENNTVDASIEDLEAIRLHCHIDSWIVFGGSYGSTLALAYAIKYKEKVKHLVLRGIFLGRQADIDWLFEFGASEFYPAEFEQYKSFIEEDKQSDIISAYYDLMTQGSKEEREAAAQQWNIWESSLVLHKPIKQEVSPVKPGDLSLGLLEAHYFKHHMFWDDDNYLLNHVSVLKDIPIHIVHGRYDVDCRVSGAYELQQQLPHASLEIIEEAGHSPFEDNMMSALLNIMDTLAK